MECCDRFNWEWMAVVIVGLFGVSPAAVESALFFDEPALVQTQPFYTVLLQR